MTGVAFRGILHTDIEETVSPVKITLFVEQQGKGAEGDVLPDGAFHIGNRGEQQLLLLSVDIALEGTRLRQCPGTYRLVMLSQLMGVHKLSHDSQSFSGTAMGIELVGTGYGERKRTGLIHPHQRITVCIGKLLITLPLRFEGGIISQPPIKCTHYVEVERMKIPRKIVCLDILHQLYHLGVHTDGTQGRRTVHTGIVDACRIPNLVCHSLAFETVHQSRVGVVGIVFVYKCA